MSYRNQYAPLDQRFWEKVDASGDCWIWTGEKNRADYGLFLGKKRRRLARKLAA